MHNFDFLSIFLCSFPSVVIFVELFVYLPITEKALLIVRISRKAFAIMNSSAISDHWKGKAMMFYSIRMIISNLHIALLLVILLICFGISYSIIGLFFLGNFQKTIQSLTHIKTQALICIVGIIYGGVRSLVLKLRSQTNHDYTLSSRILHHFALGNSIVKEIAFETDCLISRNIRIRYEPSSPVYIAGLARAGTTILLEALYSTGAFTTLTYRDMPFITAPYLWNKLTGFSRIKANKKNERAHGDGIGINYDSPEAFEEVFWMTFSDDMYIKQQYVESQKVDHVLVEKYKNYISNIVNRNNSSTSCRYLAKNNNNILRIDMIKSAFPDSVIIVPFRNPVSHAKSLQIQHRQFCKKHAEHPFTLAYMNWLGHFEFGYNIKPFKVGQNAFSSNNVGPNSFDYWLLYWNYIYEFLITQHAGNVLFFDYDKLCEQPDRYLEKLESRLELPASSLKQFYHNIRSKKVDNREVNSIKSPFQLNNVYEGLQEKCL